MAVGQAEGHVGKPAGRIDLQVLTHLLDDFEGPDRVGLGHAFLMRA